MLNLKSLVLQRLVKLISGQEYLTIQIDITNTCNLKCSHCYHANHINKDAISLDDWFEILEQYKNLTNKLLLKPSFIICGGEPLLSTKFKPLVQKIKTMWPSVPISLLTNGTLLKVEIMIAEKPVNKGGEVANIKSYSFLSGILFM